MDRGRTGLLLMVGGLALYGFVVPAIGPRGNYASLAHLAAGFSLGLGLVLMVAAALSRARSRRV